MMPVVTVLMPVYNGEDYIRESIESVLSQSFTEFEFLIINDGSCDASREIIESYNDGRIRLINQENIGLAATLNKGLRLATGKYVARIDCDDICRHERLKKQLDCFTSDNKLVLVGSNIRYIGEKGEWRGSSISPTKHAAILKLLNRGNYIYHPTVMFEKSAVINLGGYNERIGCYFEDYELWLKLSKVGKFKVLPECLVDYRVHGNSIGDNTPKEIKDIIKEVARNRGVSEDILLRMELFRSTPKPPSKVETTGEKESRYGYKMPEFFRRQAILIRNVLGK